MEFPNTVDIFSIFLLKLEIYCQDISKLSILTIFSNRRKYFWNKLLNQQKNNNGEKLTIKSDDFRNNGLEKNLRRRFGKFLDQLINRI